MENKGDARLGGDKGRNYPIVVTLGNPDKCHWLDRGILSAALRISVD